VLAVLHDANTIDQDLKVHAQKYLSEQVQFEHATKTITLPVLLKIYWEDFGNTKSNVLKWMAQIGGPELAQKMKKFLPTASNAHVASARIEFTDVNWTPILIL